MKNLFIRFRFEGARVVELDPSTITGFHINKMDTGEYYLSLYTESQEFIIETGNFDQCHALLNKIHNYLDLQFLEIK